MLFRSYPSIIGCCRYVSQSIQLPSDKDNHKQKLVQKGNYLWCSFLSAHQDPKYFKNPEEFNPERWLTEQGMMRKDMKDILSFGAYSRACIGRDLVDVIIKETIKNFTQTFKWEKLPNQDTSYRWLPVSRPVDG